jgi:hypothetical protein
MHTAVAILIANLPLRWWRPFEERYPVRQNAWLAGVLTMVAGALLGVDGFLDYLGIAADGMNTALVRAQSDLVQLQGPLLAALPVFLFTTPVGLLSLYLGLTGLVRFAAAFAADDPHGDWILTRLDDLFLRINRDTTAWDARKSREKLEGAEVADRLVTGDWLDRPDLELAILASRRRDWPAGAYLVTSVGTAYRVGEVFDLETRGGLRAVYPLTELKTGEAIRYAIPYEVPPLWRQPRQ